MGRFGFGAGEVGLLRRPKIAAAVLVFRAEPADVAGLFLGGAGVVKRNKARQHLLFSCVLCLQVLCLEIPPAVSFQDGFIQLVVDLLEEGDEALVVNLLVLGGEGFAAAEFFQDVVDAGEGEAGMLLLLALAVRVQPLAEVADALLEWGFFERGEGEGF